MREVLEERNFPVKSLRLFSSERSKGLSLIFRNKKIPVETLPTNVGAIHELPLQSIDLALFSAGKEISQEWAPRFAKNGTIVIDNSSTFRMDPKVPLVVPEVNPEVLSNYQLPITNYQNRIIANPNCSTIQLVVALFPLHKIARIRRIVVSTYQSVSGYGREAVDALKRESRTKLAESSSSKFKIRSSSQLPLRSVAKVLVQPSQPLRRSRQRRRPTDTADSPAPATATSGEKGGGHSPFPQPIAFNLIPEIDEFDEKGDSFEEQKMVNETRKIFWEPDLKITVTCVRVPVYVGHSEAVNVEFEKKISPDKAREILSQSPGVKVVDDPESSQYPLPIDASGKDEVFVGRIRKDPTVPSGLNLWIVSDNLRKGAATNAIQIAEHLISGD